ncbi:MAG: protein translocase subunit SecD [Alphaproteobacteria bacterium]|nr:protein translocase subunit SecD [Alphaproteobacteria bacterium]
MINYPRWAILITLIVCAWGVIFAAPNFFADPPAVLPEQQVNLGLDLQGGAHLLLEVEVDDVINASLKAIQAEVRRVLRRQQPRINYTGLDVDGNAVVFRLRDSADEEEARDRVQGIERDAALTVTGDAHFRLELTEQALIDRRQRAIEQSIEVVRRRVDETGVSEPTIQQQGAERIIVQMPGIDDPERIKDLLGQTAKLNFHLVNEEASVNEVVSSGIVPPSSMLLYENDGGQRIPYVVLREVVVSGERLVDAQATFQDGQPIVSFRFDAQGGQTFGRVTTENVNRRLAIVLDEEIISAPNIQSPIIGGSGIITGRFTVQETVDLALLLRAGALPAPLEILEERTVGPGLGADSIAAGKIASIVGFIAVVLFMIASYGLFGIMATVALVFNLALILALLSVLGATLTLPGIAGIVLTIGMAVDANVLILERIKEEARNGRSPIAAVDAGYRRALTTIVDSNLTTLIAALLLFNFGSGPIKGFAVTLSMGIVSSMFTAIMLTRLLMVIWLRRKRPSKLPV